MLSAATSPSRFDEFLFDPADGRLRHLPSGEAVTLRPQAARLLLALLAAAGQVVDKETLCRAVWDAGAVVDFEAGLAALMRELRQALDQLGGKAGLLETIPRRGYRLQVEVEVADPVPMTDRRTGARATPARAGWLLAAVAVLLLGGIGWWLQPPAPEPPATGVEGHSADMPRAMAVLPFQAFGQPADAPRLGVLVADTFLAELWSAELPGVALIGRATLLPYEGRDDVAGAVARDLGVGLLIEGSVSQESGGLRVTARLLEMPAGRVAWSDTVEMPGVGALPVRTAVERLVSSLQEAWPAAPE